MAPPNPSLFGRFGTAAALESQREEATKFESALEGVSKRLQDVYDVTGKGAKEQKKRQAEVAKAFEHVQKALKGTTKDAEKYGKAVEKDTRAILEFSAKHKVSIKDTLDMYDRLAERQKTHNALLSKGLDKLKRWGTVAATTGAVLSEYNKRMGEIHAGHQLFLSDLALTGPGAEAAFKQTQKYIDGYREAVRNAHGITAKWGVSAEEARSTTQALAFSLRGQIKDISQLGKVLTEDTDRIYGFAKVMNVDAPAALAYFRNQMRVQGKTHEQARKSLDTVIAGYDQMRIKVGDAAAPLKEEYLATLQQIRQELGPTQVSTAAMTAAMNMLGEAGRKAGLSAKGVGDAMAMLPKIGQNLSQFHKMQLGGMIGYNEKMLAQLPEGLRKQVQAIKEDPNIMIWEKKKIISELTAGSKVGVKAMFNMIRKAGIVEQGMMTKNLTAQQRVAFSMMKKLMREGKTFDEAMATVETGTKKAKDARETLADKLKENTTGVDGLATKVHELEKTVRKWMDQYSTLVAPAMGALTLALNAGSLVSGIKSLAGGIGGLAGRLGGAGGGLIGRVAMFAGKAGLVGIALGGLYLGLRKAAGALDKWQTKTIRGVAARKSVERALGAVGKEKSYESRVTQMKTMIGRDNFLTLEGKINRAFLAKKAMQVVSGTGEAEQRGREYLIAKWTKKLEEITGKRGDMFGKGAELKEAARRRKLDIDVARENEKRRLEGKSELRRRRGEKTIEQMLDRERREQVRAQRGQFNLQSALSPARARVPAAATRAPEMPQADLLAERPAAAAMGRRALTQFDPATGTYTAQMTISANDPNWQSFFQRNQAIMNQGKRSR